MLRLSGSNEQISISVLCLVLFGTVLALAGCGKQLPGKKEHKRTGLLQAVRIMKVKPAPPEVRAFPGRTEAVDEATLSFQLTGTVRNIPVKVGQKMKKGDVIARLDAAYYQDALNGAEAELESVRAKFTDARLTFERDQELWASKDIDASEMDASRARYRSLKKRVENAKAAVAEARDDLSHTVIYAPYDGSITDKHVNAHEVATTGQPVADLTGESGFQVKTYIPEKYFLLKDRFTEYRCRFASYPGKTVQAKLKGIGKKALSPTKTYPLKVRLVKKEDLKIYAGMEVEVLITIARSGEKKNEFVLPSSSVVSGDEGKPVVWTYNKKNGTVSSRPVQLGRIVSSGVEIIGGLEGGEYAVTAGGDMLREGQKVKPVADHIQQGK